MGRKRGNDIGFALPFSYPVSYKRSDESISLIVSSFPSLRWTLTFLSVLANVILLLHLPQSEVKPFLELELDQSGFQAL